MGEQPAAPLPGNQVTLGHPAQRVVLDRFTAPSRADPYAGGTFVVTLSATGLSVVRTVFVYRHSALGAYFSELADEWRGWLGTKVWESPENDLTINATSDAGRHARLRFVVRNGPLYDWTASVDVEVDAGEEMAGIARDVELLMMPVNT